MRASLYNAITEEHTASLVRFMHAFAAKHAVA
jgi:phosphoserine aminotransferase